MAWQRRLWPLTLASDEVHVWRASLDRPDEALAGFSGSLSVDERRRAGRLISSQARRDFIVGRSILRAILAGYLRRPQASLSFIYSRYGKPALAGDPEAESLRFNLAHSYGSALYAVTWGREIGVDLERIRANVHADRIADRFFSDKERDVLRQLPPEKRLEAFFTCWARKEAYIKARGIGLALPLNEFDVSLAPGEPAALLFTRDDPHEAGRWRLQDLYPDPGYAAALAVDGHSWRLSCGDWPEDREKKGGPQL
jgi:4'-phosphopantetheinyl transferase